MSKAIQALKAIKMTEPQPIGFKLYSDFKRKHKVYKWYMQIYNIVMEEITPPTIYELCDELNKSEIDFIATPQKWAVVEVGNPIVKDLVLTYPNGDGSDYTEFLSNMSFSVFAGYPELQKKIGLYFSEANK